jgi:hypothetical protein
VPETGMSVGGESGSVEVGEGNWSRPHAEMAKSNTKMQGRILLFMCLIVPKTH